MEYTDLQRIFFFYYCEKKQSRERISDEQERGQPGDPSQSGKQSTKRLHGFLLPCPVYTFIWIILARDSLRPCATLGGPGTARGFSFFSKKKKVQPFSLPGLFANFPVPLGSSTNSQMLVKAQTRLRSSSSDHRKRKLREQCSDANLDRSLNKAIKGLAGTGFCKATTNAWKYQDSPSTALERRLCMLYYIAHYLYSSRKKPLELQSSFI